MMFLGLLSQQAAGNLIEERLKCEDFLTKRTLSHYKLPSELTLACDIGETHYMRNGGKTDLAQSET
jgi:hypothetical protein